MQEYKNFHDGHLLGFRILPKQECVLFVTDIWAATYEIRLHGVYRFWAKGFREGNIILDATFVSGALLARKDLVFFLNDNPDSDNARYLDILEKEVKARKVGLFELNPSYGCELASLCTSYEVLASKPTEQKSFSERLFVPGLARLPKVPGDSTDAISEDRERS